jgi:hypothetical protein
LGTASLGASPWQLGDGGRPLALTNFSQLLEVEMRKVAFSHGKCHLASPAKRLMRTAETPSNLSAGLHRGELSNPAHRTGEVWGYKKTCAI